MTRNHRHPNRHKMQTHSHRGPGPNTRLHTSNANIQKNVWSLGSLVKYLISLSHICLFSTSCSRHFIWHLYTLVSRCLYLLLPAVRILANGWGQRLNWPKGLVRCSDSCQGFFGLSVWMCMSVYVCVCRCVLVCEDGDIIPLDSGGHRLMRSLTDPWERRHVSKQWEGTVV